MVVVVIAALLYVVFQPSEFDVTRSKVMKAPVSSVFSAVNEMKTWETWGLWNEEDPTIKVVYGEKSSGEGASNSWTSKDGPGNMTIVKVVLNQRIEQKIQFRDADPSDIIWTFEETSEGTKVTWRMKEDKVPFGFKVASAMFGGYDNLLGGMWERGLNNLDEFIAQKITLENSFRMDEIQSINVEAKKFVGFFQQTSTDITHEDMTKLFTEFMPKVGVYASKNGMAYGDYTPSCVYTKWDEEAKEAEFYIGLLMNKELKPGKGMSEITVPAGKGLMVRKYGKYGTGDMEAHAEIAKFMEANKLEATDLVWELYTNDPTEVQPQDIQTDIYYLLK